MDETDRDHLGIGKPLLVPKDGPTGVLPGINKTAVFSASAARDPLAREGLGYTRRRIQCLAPLHKRDPSRLRLGVIEDDDDDLVLEINPAQGSESSEPDAATAPGDVRLGLPARVSVNMGFDFSRSLAFPPEQPPFSFGVTEQAEMEDALASGSVLDAALFLAAPRGPARERRELEYFVDQHKSGLFSFDEYTATLSGDATEAPTREGSLEVLVEKRPWKPLPLLRRRLGIISSTASAPPLAASTHTIPAGVVRAVSSAPPPPPREPVADDILKEVFGKTAQQPERRAPRREVLPVHAGELGEASAAPDASFEEVPARRRRRRKMHGVMG